MVHEHMPCMTRITQVPYGEQVAAVSVYVNVQTSFQAVLQGLSQQGEKLPAA